MFGYKSNIILDDEYINFILIAMCSSIWNSYKYVDENEMSWELYEMFKYQTIKS